MAALFHDVGKSRVPLEVLNKQGGLTDEEWRIMQAHPWLGVLTLFGLRGYGEIPYRGMIVAYEHHMKTDLTGYPKSLRPRGLSIYSKIVAVADGFDAATSRRVYQTVPIQPDQVLKEMWENPRRGYDAVVVKAFINLIGIYPVGTCVILDTYEVALVHSANPDVTHVHRPVVRIVTTPEGGVQHPGFLADLAQRDAAGNHPRSIVKVTDPVKYGINVSDYFVRAPDRRALAGHPGKCRDAARRTHSVPDCGIPDARGVARGPAARRRRGCGLRGSWRAVLGSARGRPHHPTLDPGRARPGHDGAACARPDPPRRARDSRGSDDVFEPAHGLRARALRARGRRRRRVGAHPH